MSVLSPENPGIRMINRRVLYFDKLTEAEYTIEDVATVLGRIQRFGNHAPKPYSVAEHLVHASNLYARNPKGALMHDAPEWLLGDLATPVKKRTSGFSELEDEVEADMARRFNYTPCHDPVFKVVDNILFQCEHAALFEQPEVYNIEIPFQFWKPKAAKKEFLKRFKHLSLDC